MGPLLPHFPPCVLEQWLHRHSVHAEWKWLGLKGLVFERACWSSERIYSEVKFTDHDRSGEWSQQFRTEPGLRDSFLGRFMLEHGTWPAPIIVLKNDFQLRMPNGLKLSEPFNLLEGNRRLNCFRAMHEDGLPVLLCDHVVWVARVDPTQVSAAW